jgi:multisubunit Na+/H+ antiporter MnhC subunit
MAYIYPTAVHSVSDTFQDHVNRGSVNPGTDYTDAYGDTVVAVAAGTVTDASNDNGGGGGRTIHIDHDDGSGADYLHLASVGVYAGQWVAQGTAIGASGASGYGDDWYYGAHLHISFRNNHSHGYGNNGNVDFDALVKESGSTPTPPPAQQKEDIEMRIVQVPSGTIALVGEYTGQKYTSASGSQGFSYQANIAGYGTSTGLTEDQVSTLVSEAATRRNALVSDVANKVEAEIGASASGLTARSMLWALVIGAALIVLAIVVAFVPGEPSTVTTLAEVLIGAGAIVVGFALGGLRGANGRGRHIERGDDHIEP